MDQLTEDSIEKALEYLNEGADDAAKARAERIYLEEYRKHLKAIIMCESSIQPLGAQERNAYADRRYREHLVALKTAVEQDEKHRFLREAAQAKVNAWQTYCANKRGVRV